MAILITYLYRVRHILGLYFGKNRQDDLVLKKVSESGSVIAILFMLVGVFGFVSFAFLSNTKTSTKWLENERSKAMTYSSNDCEVVIEHAIKKLESRGCGNKISYQADGSNTNPGAPADGSCSVFHLNGGGAKPCNSTAIAAGAPPANDPCMAALSVGQGCVGLLYAGMSGGTRLYAMPADEPMLSWNNGTTNYSTLTATSTSDGFANTNILVGTSNSGSPYLAAQQCRNLGPKWYLPAPDELATLYSVRNTGSFSGTFYTAGGGASRYWSSRQVSNSQAIAVRLATGGQDSRDKDEPLRIRCVRRD